MFFCCVCLTALLVFDTVDAVPADRFLLYNEDWKYSYEGFGFFGYDYPGIVGIEVYALLHDYWAQTYQFRTAIRLSASTLETSVGLFRLSKMDAFVSSVSLSAALIGSFYEIPYRNLPRVPGPALFAGPVLTIDTWVFCLRVGMPWLIAGNHQYDYAITVGFGFTTQSEIWTLLEYLGFVP